MSFRPASLCLMASAAALTLVGCEAESTESGNASASANDGGASGSGEGQTSGTAIIASESGWLTVGTDGAVQTTYFDAGGRYRDYRNGELISEGGWEQRADGKLCFEPDTGLGACWETASEDGDTAVATDESGKAIEIKRITYIAPTEAEESDEAGS